MRKFTENIENCKIQHYRHKVKKKIFPQMLQKFHLQERKIMCKNTNYILSVETSFSLSMFLMIKNMLNVKTAKIIKK